MKPSKSTIVRTIVLVVMLINQLLAAFGKSPLPFSDEQVDTFVSTVLTVVSSIWAWWKNNSFTKDALKADEVLKELKAKQ
jgi:SPP1 family holin